jgi:integrase
MARTTETPPPAKSRRARGEGSYWTDPRTGRVVYTSKTLIPGKTVKGRGRTKKDAREDAISRASHVAAGRESGKPETFGEMMEAWLEVGVKPHATRERWRNHRSNLRYLQPLEDIPAHLIRSSDLERVYLKMVADGFTRGAVRSVKSTASRAFRWAVGDGRIAGRDSGALWNPGLTSTLPAMDPDGSRTAPDPASVDAFLKVMDPTHNGVIWRLMTECALRPSEAAGLRWEDLDLDAGLIRVRGALRWDGTIREYRWARGTKTDGGKRNLPIGGELVRLLHAHRAAARALQLSSEWASDEWAGDLVFRKVRDGRGLDYRHLGHVHRNTLRTIEGVEWFVPYQLRHHLPTRLAHRGVPVSTVAALLGDDARTAARYYIDAPEVAVDYEVLRIVLDGTNG